MSLRRGDVLIVLGLIAFLAVVSLTAPRWVRLLVSAFDDTVEEMPAEPVPAATPVPEAEKRIGVKLFFESPETPVLVTEERSVPFSDDLARQAKALVEELSRPSDSGNLPPLPPETRVLAVFAGERGVVYVDLSKEAVAGHVGGVAGERLAVYAIVNSITANLPAIRRVQILIDDKPAETFAGHVDLSRPLWPDMTLVAEAVAGAVTAPAAEAPAAPVPAASPPGNP
jgi:hypothetical protein